MPEYRKEWLLKAKIDYFAPFVNLWLSCNAWFMDHYSELGPTDRDHINKVKTDFSGRNHLYKKFETLITDSGRDGQIFRGNLEQLHYSLLQAALVNDKIGDISFEKAVLDYANKGTKTNLIRNPKLNADGQVCAKDKPDVQKLENIYVTSKNEDLFAGLFEIIYSTRNNLIHGKMNPSDNEYRVVKFCYLVLYDLMNF